MKEWLRELSEPLVPAELYPESIASVRDMDTPADIMSKRVLEIFDKLPVLTQRVIRVLGDLLKEIAKEENSAINLMTMDNLAIVFSPSLLRCPSDDPMELLSNSKFETRFTSVLFRSI